MNQKEKYEECAKQVVFLMQRWIDNECQTRSPDLRFLEWGRVAYAGPLAGSALDRLCASPDARRMCEWVDEQTGHEATLLMAYAAIEKLGLKSSSSGKEA